MYIKACSFVSALGRSLEEALVCLSQGKSRGLIKREDFLSLGRPLLTGCVAGELPQIPQEFSEHDSRTNRLLLSCLHQIQTEVADAADLYGKENIAVVLGTSTSGLHEADLKASSVMAGQDLYPNWSYQSQEMGDEALFLAKYLGLKGPAYTVSTACSSSLRAVISAVRLIRCGLCKAAIAGGADSLSRVTISGFSSLGLVSSTMCTPFAKGRDGIVIGEGAGLMLIAKDPSDLKILGCSESSDAYHVSAPHPEGKGAASAMRGALEDAGLKARDIAYVNLHGTASELNDKAEACAMHEVFDKVPCSSTKYLTGHCLGASGIVELGICALTLKHNLAPVPQDFSLRPYDESLGEFGLLKERAMKLKRPLIMSNALAFGGNNASLIIGGAEHD